MEPDSRFPNRKRKGWDEPVLGDKLPAAELQEFNSESAEVEPLPVSSYRVFGLAQENPGDQPVELEEQDPVVANGSEEAQTLIGVSGAAEEQKTAAGPPIPPPSFEEAWIARIRKFAQSPPKVYAAAGVGLGILLVAIIAVFSSLTAPPNGRYDLGSVTSSAAGLEGHLFIQWDKRLEYRLTFKPSDPDRQAAFALAVAKSPRPLSIEIRLLDSGAFVLCSKQIVLEYDPRNAAALAGSAPASAAGDTDAGTSSSDQPAQETDFAQLDAQEAAREQGKDIFRTQIDANGQLVAIQAQGNLSCSAEAYEKAASWGFLATFPSIAEQDEWIQRQQEIKANAERPSPAEVASTRKRMAAKAAARVLPFSMEGDDSIVDFDVSRGMIQTRGRKTFFVDKTIAAAADSSWQDYPVSIHYRCDQTASCTLKRSGGGSLRVKLGS